MPGGADDGLFFALRFGVAGRFFSLWFTVALAGGGCKVVVVESLSKGSLSRYCTTEPMLGSILLVVGVNEWDFGGDGKSCGGVWVGVAGRWERVGVGGRFFAILAEFVFVCGLNVQVRWNSSSSFLFFSCSHSRNLGFMSEYNLT